MRTDASFWKVVRRGALLIGLLAVLPTTFPAAAQTDRTAPATRAGEGLYARIGIGFGDYTGDLGSSSFGDAHSHPLDLQGFVWGVPYYGSGELGYAVSPHVSVGLGLQVGSYPIINGVSFNSGTGTYRTTSQLVGRYTFRADVWTVAPYLEGGVAALFGGPKLGFGPALGVGIDIALSSSTSIYVGSRFNAIFPDEAADGRSDAVGPNPERPSFPDVPFDLVNQLLSVGFRTDLSLGLFSDGSPSENPPVPAADRSSGSDARRHGDNGSAPADSDGASAPDPSSGGSPPSAPLDSTVPAGMVYVPDGTFVMGLSAEDPLDLQNAGRKRVTTSGFLIDSTEVTNAEYRAYLRGLDPEARQARRPDSTAWQEARSAESFSVYFRGERFAEHPVVAVTWAEARAYCQAQGGRLPTEAEWERAARGGLVGKRFPWGDELCPDGEHRCNIWQGAFPTENTAEDGYEGTAPVDAFRQNEFGLYNAAGNVWEWCGDWFTADHPEGPLSNPTGPPEGDEKVIRGGSYLCHDSYCNRYRVAARSSTPPTSTTGNCGFRCALDA